MEDFNLHRSFQFQLKTRDPTLIQDPTCVLLDPTKRGLRNPTLRVCKTQLARRTKNSTITATAYPSIWSSSQLATSSILVIINSKPRQVDKALEIQLKILTKSNVKSPSHQCSIFNHQASSKSPTRITSKTPKHQPKQTPPKPPNASTKSKVLQC